MKLPLLRVLALAALLCRPSLAADSRSEAKTAEGNPNIVLIVADDLGQRDVGCYGSTFHKTPHIDALARRGMLFRNAYSASPLCSPTRASILTGLAPARIGITAPNCHVAEVMLEKRLAGSGARVRVADSITRLKTDYLTLPEVLRDAGWHTGHLGKWHLGAEPYSPLQHGFASDLPHTPGPGPGGGNGYFAPWSFWKGEGQPGDHIEDRMAAEAEKFIAANKARPFFLNYWAFSVHSPWMAKDAYIAEATPRADKHAPQRNAMYAGMVRSLDDAVGRITAALEANGVAENTLIIFTSDNGGWHNVAKEATKNKAFAAVPVTSNAPFRSGKASNYEGGTRVPLLAVWPGKIAPGTTSDALAQSTDFFPTLLELTQLPPPAGVKFDGASIAPALRGEPMQRDTIFSHFPHGGRSDIGGFRPATWVRRGDWKLIRFFADNDDGSDKLELFNLREDIGETKNLAAENPARAAALNALIAGYLKDTEAVVPVLNTAPAPAKDGRDKKDAMDPLLGWKARGCNAAVKDGILTVTGTSAAPFLGFAPGKLAADAKLHIRIRSNGGSGKIEWLLGAKAAPDTAKSAEFKLTANEWAEVTADIPATPDQPGILRLHLPAQEKPAELDWLELQSSDTKPRRWDF